MSVNYIDENGNMTNIAPLQDAYSKTETDALLDGKADSSTTSLAKENQMTLGYSAKNLLPMTVDGIKSANIYGTWDGNTWTVNGITVAIQTDSYDRVVGFKVDGTANSITTFSLSSYTKMSGEYILNGCPNNGSIDSYRLDMRQQADGGVYKNCIDYGNGAVYTSTNDEYIKPVIRIANGYAIPSGGLTFYPMIRPASITDPTFEPYAETVDYRLKEIVSYVDYDNTAVGVEVDMEAKTVTRIGGAVGKSAGSDFDSINAFGGRRRCNLADDGTVNAYYGDSGYVEDGSNGQVMVEQPKFYYKVVPLKVDKASKGWILRKARYYVSDKPREGFKVHPEFMRSGKIKEKIYHSAFEGCLYDTSASAYITDDAQVADFSADKLSSIAGAKPISGKTQNLTRANTRKLAENRGLGWEQMTIQSASATQLLMLIEYATFNMQSALSAGNYTKTDDGSSNMSENTGATSSLGNASGEVTNGNGIKLFSYRGEENFYANIWKWIDGLNKLDQVVYIADHGFADDTKNGYKDAGIVACDANGYIKAFCYSEDFDWLFIPAEIGGDSALPVGDYYWYAAGWRVASLGGSWYAGAHDGAFCLYLDDASSYRYRLIGGRLLYIPDTDESSDKALSNEELTTIVNGVIENVSISLSDSVSSSSEVYYSQISQTVFLNLNLTVPASSSNTGFKVATLNDHIPASTVRFSMLGYKQWPDGRFYTESYPIIGSIYTSGEFFITLPEGVTHVLGSATFKFIS